MQISKSQAGIPRKKNWVEEILHFTLYFQCHLHLVNITLSLLCSGWLFPIMWLIVSKPTQFAAVWKLITQSSDKDLSVPLLAYCAHLSLGDAWNKVFFGLECTGRGLAVILTFWSVLLLSAYLFYGVDQSAGLLLVPTSLWVTVATALNWSIYVLNKGNCDA